MKNKMYELVKKLFPLCRSLTGDEVRKTLKILREHIPLKISEVPTGTKVFDWTVPQEWNIKDAYVIDPAGKKVIDFKKHNLHIVGYSIPVNKTIALPELQKHLYSLPDQPTAIPYVTSYYQPRWGFCLKHQDREKLKPGKYRVVVDSELKKGSLTFGELIIPGLSQKEVFLSTYVCHPSMANNELSGPAVTTFLAKWLLTKKRRYAYRIIFIPETIGSIMYLSKNLNVMKNAVVAGFNISCVGDERNYSYVSSRNGETYANKVAQFAFESLGEDFTRYSYLDRGSDERQYNSPGVDLPVVSISRSKYGTYPEYHTSLDDLNLVTPRGLYGSYELLKHILELIEKNYYYQNTCLGEPQLGRRGLYPTVSKKGSAAGARRIIDFLAYADGTNDLIDISRKIKIPIHELYPIVKRLLKEKLITAQE